MFVLAIAAYLFFARQGVAQNEFYGKSEHEIKDCAKSIAQNSSNFFEKTPTSSMQFLLSRKNCTTPVFVTENNATEQINLTLVTFFIIHGWTGNGTLPWIKDAARSLHSVGEFNVIAVDWRVLASGDYFRAVKNIKIVGYRIKDFIKAVNITVDRVHIIGHSLGGQVAAFVANALDTEKVLRIDGLDPAGPLFDWPFRLAPKYRLSADDAKMVQVIHTSVFFRGVTIPSGTIDFYVNKGVNQPGCPSNNTISCSHQMSATYYILTINNTHKYPGTKWCSSRLVECTSGTAFMGFGVNTTKLGIYNVTTTATGIDPDAEF